MAAVKNLVVVQADVTTAFLHGKLKEEIYIRPPPGFPNPGKVYKLHKSLYGLKQSARVWNETLNKALLSIGFRQSVHDKCLYVLNKNAKVSYLIVHVDDILLAASSHEMIKFIISSLQKSFPVKNMGEPSKYLGMNISRDKEGFCLSQEIYIEKIASDFQLLEAKGSKYPLDPGYHKITDSPPLPPENQFRKIIGMLLYVAINTRPDVAASVNILAQHVATPRQVDMNEAQRVVKYLMATKTLVLHLSSHRNSDTLIAFSDANWAEDKFSRKSVSGVLCLMLGSPISWRSKKQSLVALSTTEAELYALAETVKELKWLRKLLSDFDCNINSPIKIQCDNMSTICMVKNEDISDASKHIDSRIHFVRDEVQHKRFDVIHCPTDLNVADLMTKPLGRIKLEQFREAASLKHKQELKLK